MCYSSGSIDETVNPCPMCKVFPNTRCPHVRDICRNRALHPRTDVLYLKNAEVDSFNGCGFCKWATKDSKYAGYNNQGSPGCCRPPQPNEYDSIQAADWRAVSIVHNVAIPQYIKAVLPFRTGPSPPSSPTNRPPSKPVPSRKTSSTAMPSSKSNVLSAKPMNTPLSRGRSPNLGVSSSANISRSSSSTQISSSVPSPTAADLAHRRKATSDKRIEGIHSSNSSPSRKPIDLENPSTPRRMSSVRRPTVTPATTSVSVSKIIAADSRQDISPGKRRLSISSSPTSPSTPQTQPTRSADRAGSFIVPRTTKHDDDCSASTSSGSSDGISSLSDSTVTSDGGFTDYLSDESEAELQRQAEAKAALYAQMQAEEHEFKMARQKLAHVDLRPPRTWNPDTNPAMAPTTAPNAFQTSRNANVPSFGAAAATMVQQAGTGLKEGRRMDEFQSGLAANT